jgi:membrane protein
MTSDTTHEQELSQAPATAETQAQEPEPQAQQPAPPKRGSGSKSGAFKRTIREFRADNLTDLAAALTYYGVLAIFPALLAVVSILSLIGHSVTQPLLNNLSTFAPGQARQIIANSLHSLQHGHGSTAGIVFVVALAGALWSASSYIAAFMRASNIIYDVEEGRPFWVTVPVRLIVTVFVVVLLVLSAFAVIVTGPLARHFGNLVGVGSTAVSIWDIAKWPVMVLIVCMIFSLLYWASPNVKPRGFKTIIPGGVFAVAVWLVASAAFALFVANFSSYNKTYGTLAGVIIFLVWLWISNTALLLGAELNAELERGRHIEAGHPADQEPYVEPRRAKHA